MSKGGSKTSTNTQTTTIDPAVMAKWNDVYDRAVSAVDSASNPYSSYGGELVAGFTEPQNTAMRHAMDNLANAQGTDYYGALSGQLGQDIGSIASADLSVYMNPYTDQVVDRSLSAIDDSRKKALQGVGDQAQAAGAFGGDRQAILEAETNRQYGDLAADTAANLYQNAYTNAQSAAQQDINNRHNQIGQQSNLANLGINAQNAALTGAYGIGSDLQATNQRADTTNWEQYYNGTMFPQQQASYLAGIMSGMPYGTSTTGITTTPTSSNIGSSLLGGGLLGSTLFPKILGSGVSSLGGSAIGAGLSLLSDRRMKKDIKRIGTLDNGLPVYTFRYKHDPAAVQVGCMADEVKELRPDAVTNHGGIDFVNYELATATV